ncbi:hypothetical protein ACJX0J_030347 [Zea mays]
MNMYMGMNESKNILYTIQGKGSKHYQIIIVKHNESTHEHTDSHWGNRNAVMANVRVTFSFDGVEDGIPLVGGFGAITTNIRERKREDTPIQVRILLHEFPFREM